MKLVKLFILGLGIALLFIDNRIVPRSAAFSGGPDPGRTGAPGELTCATGECHGSNRNTGPGRFTILAPREYEPGKTYEIEIRHATNDLSRARWGFQLTALTGANARAGTFQNLNDLTQIVEERIPGFERQYIQHTAAGTYPEQIGAASWRVRWTAPATDVGAVTFYAAGNQADNNGNSSGDQIYTTTQSIQPAPPQPGEDLQQGSVLVFNLFSSDPLNRAEHDTRISLTNASSAKAVTAHLFFINGADGVIEDGFLCLAPGKTTAFLTSDIDPGTTGYLIVVASDPVTGCAVKANSLLGEAFLKLGNGQAANLSAEAFPALADVSCAAGATAATLRFDGMNNATVPSSLALAPIDSIADDIQTLLIVNRFGGDLRTPLPSVGEGNGTVFDDAANPFAFRFTSNRPQLFVTLSEDFPATTPRFPQLIPAGRSGWMKFGLLKNASLTGSLLTRGHGRNLPALTRTSTAVLTVPVYPPSC
jgi:hypothetical protein